MNSPIVSTIWLNEHLHDSDLIILEVHQEVNKAGLKYDFEGKIPGSITIDMKSDFSDVSGKYSNTFPKQEHFEATCDRLGITKNSKIVVVDRLGIYTSPRIWYIFKTMGHDHISILDGGLPAWVADGFETVLHSAEVSSNSGYTANPNWSLIRYIDDIQNNLEDKECLIIDARSSGRFHGTTPEPRKGLRGGSIPYSVNIPFKHLLEEGRYKSKEELKAIFGNLDVGSKSLVFTCGSGVTACIIMIAAVLVLENEMSVYDGSWTEWASEVVV